MHDEHKGVNPHRLDGSFVATVLETATVGVLFLAWQSITEGALPSPHGLPLVLMLAHLTEQRTGKKTRTRASAEIMDPSNLFHQSVPPSVYLSLALTLASRLDVPFIPGSRTQPVFSSSLCPVMSCRYRDRYPTQEPRTESGEGTLGYLRRQSREGGNGREVDGRKGQCSMR